jgi:hypothetical protein
MKATKQHPSFDAKAEMGFHGLKDLLTTREYLLDHCDFLAACVHEAAWATRGAAFLCRRSTKGLHYLGLTRKPGALLTHPEVRYERAMFQKWRTDNGSPDCGWERIVDYQVPVSDRKPSLLGLRAIDLLGVNSARLPAVIELKVSRKKKEADSPLRAILEAASYACVLQADWEAFSLELEEATRSLGPCPTLPRMLEQVPLVVAGSPEYWEFWNNEDRTSMGRAKPALKKLVNALFHEGYPVFSRPCRALLLNPKHSLLPELDFWLIEKRGPIIPYSNFRRLVEVAR